MGLKIIVLAKQVPDTRNVGKDAMTAEGTVNRAALPAIFNPEDLNALEQALRLKEQNPGSTVGILTMGPPRAAEIIRQGLYRGADTGWLLTDRLFAGADTLATSYARATAIKKIGGADIIIGGKSLLDFLHPVGSYYWSDNSTSPATLFGGTWVKVEGRFLFGSGGVYSVGDTGGEVEHTLTVEEMPSHRHPFAGSGDFSNYDGRNSSINKQGSAYSGEPGLYNGADYSSSGYIAMQHTGGGAAHNNMPPYYTTNIWRRTA